MNKKMRTILRTMVDLNVDIMDDTVVDTIERKLFNANDPMSKRKPNHGKLIQEPKHKAYISSKSTPSHYMEED